MTIYEVRGRRVKSYSRIITLKVSPRLLEKLEEVAEKTGATRSELIRVGIMRVIEDPPSRDEIAKSILLASDRRW